MSGLKDEAAPALSRETIFACQTIASDQQSSSAQPVESNSSVASSLNSPHHHQQHTYLRETSSPFSDSPYRRPSFGSNSLHHTDISHHHHSSLVSAKLASIIGKDSASSPLPSSTSLPHLPSSASSLTTVAAASSSHHHLPSTLTLDPRGRGDDLILFAEFSQLTGPVIIRCLPQQRSHQQHQYVNHLIAKLFSVDYSIAGGVEE